MTWNAISCCIQWKIITYYWNYDYVKQYDNGFFLFARFWNISTITNYLFDTQLIMKAKTQDKKYDLWNEIHFKFRVTKAHCPQRKLTMRNSKSNWSSREMVIIKIGNPFRKWRIIQIKCHKRAKLVFSQYNIEILFSGIKTYRFLLSYDNVFLIMKIHSTQV